MKCICISSRIFQNKLIKFLLRFFYTRKRIHAVTAYNFPIFFFLIFFIFNIKFLFHETATHKTIRTISTIVQKLRIETGSIELRIFQLIRISRNYALIQPFVFGANIHAIHHVFASQHKKAVRNIFYVPAGKHHIAIFGKPSVMRIFAV